MTKSRKVKSQREMIRKTVLLLIAAGLSNTAAAELSVTLTGASDYRFNGVTQTGHQPAAQASLDWAGEQGLYAGIWGSNVDFDDDTKAEVDLYGGYSFEFRPGYTLDVGIAWYTYHGASYSSDSNYAEVYAKLGVAGFKLSAWYANDYGGQDVGHVTISLAKDFEINDRWTIAATVGQMSSLDKDRFAWDDNDDSYVFWQVMNNTSYAGFDFSLGVTGTDLSYSAGDTAVLFTVARTFAF